MNIVQAILVGLIGFCVGALIAFSYITQVIRKRDRELKRHWETWHFTRQGVTVIWNKEVMLDTEDDQDEGGNSRPPSHLRGIEGGKE